MAIKEDLETAKEEVAALQAEYDEFIKRENPFKVGFDLAMYSDDWSSSGDDEVNKNQVINFDNISRALAARSTNPEDFMSLLNEGWKAGWKLCHNSSYATYDMSGTTGELNESDAVEFFEWQRLIISHGIYLMGEYFESGSDYKLYIDSEVVAERVCSYLVTLFDEPTVEDKDLAQEEASAEVSSKPHDSSPTRKEEVEKEKKAAFRIGFDFGLKFGIVSGSSGECKYDIAAIGHEFAKKSPYPADFADAFQEGFIAGKRCPATYIRYFSGYDDNFEVDNEYSEFIKLIYSYGVDLHNYYDYAMDNRNHYYFVGVNGDQIDYSIMDHLLSLFKIDETDSSLKVTPVVPSGEWATCDSPTKAILDNPEMLKRFTEAWNNLAENRPRDDRFG